MLSMQRGREETKCQIVKMKKGAIGLDYIDTDDNNVSDSYDLDDSSNLDVIMKNKVNGLDDVDTDDNKVADGNNSDDSSNSCKICTDDTDEIPNLWTGSYYFDQWNIVTINSFEKGSKGKEDSKESNGFKGSKGKGKGGSKIRAGSKIEKGYYDYSWSYSYCKSKSNESGKGKDKAGQSRRQQK